MLNLCKLTVGFLFQGAPKPIAIEPCAGNRAAVLTVFLCLPRGSSGAPPPGQSGMMHDPAVVSKRLNEEKSYTKNSVRTLTESNSEHGDEILLAYKLSHVCTFSKCL